jgi:hypothetical protein
MRRFDLRFALARFVVRRFGLVEHRLGGFGLGRVFGEEAAEDHWGKIVDSGYSGKADPSLRS